MTKKASPIPVLIVEDEPLAREAIKKYLLQWPQFDIVAECSNGLEAIGAIRSMDPAVVLLDIEMPELNGLEVLRKTANRAIHFVFITAFEQYAVMAFEENAADYILKPYTEERFEAMLNRVLEKIDQEVVPAKVRQAGWPDLPATPRYLAKLTCKSKGKIRLLNVSSVCAIESAGAFCKLKTDNTTEFTNLTMKELEKMLDPTKFLRIHKSFMVNIDHIESLESYFHGEYILHLSNGAQVKLSRSYKDRLTKILNQYL